MDVTDQNLIAQVMDATVHPPERCAVHLLQAHTGDFSKPFHLILSAQGVGQRIDLHIGEQLGHGCADVESGQTRGPGAVRLIRVNGQDEEKPRH